MLPTKFRFIWPSGFRGEELKQIDQSETRIAFGGHVCSRIGRKCAILIKDLPEMLPTKLRIIWLSGFREDFFRNRPIRNKNCLWQPCLLTDRDKMNNLYRWHFIDASYQVSFLFGQAVAEKIFRNWPIRNKNCLLQLGLLTDLDKMSNLYRGLSIDASYQVSVHLAMWFQRRRF
jgi:hypothetical protein